MQSLTPAQDELEARRKREAIELCGKNRGPHDYIPIEWFYVDQGDIRKKRVNRFICRVCFNTVNISTLIAMYKDVSLEETHDIGVKIQA